MLFYKFSNLFLQIQLKFSAAIKNDSEPNYKGGKL